MTCNGHVMRVSKCNNILSGVSLMTVPFARTVPQASRQSVITWRQPATAPVRGARSRVTTPMSRVSICDTHKDGIRPAGVTMAAETDSDSVRIQRRSFHESIKKTLHRGRFVGSHADPDTFGSVAYATHYHMFSNSRGAGSIYFTSSCRGSCQSLQF
jgi:hypothetical protein